MEQIISQIPVDELIDRFKQSIMPEIEKVFKSERNKEIPSLLNKNQVAKIIKRSPSTISNMIKDGRLKATSDNLIAKESLNELLVKLGLTELI